MTTFFTLSVVGGGFGVLRQTVSTAGSGNIQMLGLSFTVFSRGSVTSMFTEVPPNIYFCTTYFTSCWIKVQFPRQFADLKLGRPEQFLVQI